MAKSYPLPASITRLLKIYGALIVLVFGLAGIIFYRAVVYVTYVETIFFNVFIWQLISWFPWFVIIGVIEFYRHKKKGAFLNSGPNWKTIFLGLVISGLSVLWFKFVSQNISPFLGYEEARYGVFRWFFIFGFLINFFLFMLITLFMQKNSELEPDASEKGNYLEHFFVRSGKISDVVKVDDVVSMEAQDCYINIHTFKKNYLVRAALSDLENELSPKKFIRVHRSYIINLDFVDCLQQLETRKYVVRLRDGTECPLSRSGLVTIKEKVKILS